MKKYDLLIIFALVLIVILIASGVRIQSVEDYYLEHAQDLREGDPRVTLSVSSGILSEDETAKYPQFAGILPGDGMILPPADYVLREGDSVFDLLVRATAVNRVLTETSGSGRTAYVEGIASLCEYSLGEDTGWIFLVNGEAPTVGAGQYLPRDGDVIEWIYTRSLSDFLNRTPQP